MFRDLLATDQSRGRTTSCPSPDLCPFAQGGLCKPYGRLYVNLDESDEFGTFVFRTTGFRHSNFGSTLKLLLCSVEWLAVLPAIATDLKRQENYAVIVPLCITWT
jgi:hypothetical protein